MRSREVREQSKGQIIVNFVNQNMWKEREINGVGDKRRKEKINGRSQGETRRRRKEDKTANFLEP